MAYFNNSVDDEALQLLAKASQGVPRKIKKLTERLLLLNSNESRITSEHVEELFKYENISLTGFSNSQQKYLKYLYQQPEKTLRLQLIAQHLGLDPRSIRCDVEPGLVDNGLIIVTPLGRKLSRKAIELIVSNVLEIENNKLGIK